MAAAPITPYKEGENSPTGLIEASDSEAWTMGVVSPEVSPKSSVEIWAQTTVAAIIQAVVVRIGFISCFELMSLGDTQKRTMTTLRVCHSGEADLCL